MCAATVLQVLAPSYDVYAISGRGLGRVTEVAPATGAEAEGGVTAIYLSGSPAAIHRAAPAAPTGRATRLCATPFAPVLEGRVGKAPTVSPTVPRIEDTAVPATRVDAEVRAQGCRHPLGAHWCRLHRGPPF